MMQMVISEGRNRQIRKMCEAVGLEVARLKRVSIGPVRLGMLPPGQWRELTDLELNTLNGMMRSADQQARERADRPIREMGGTRVARAQKGRR